MITIFIPTPLRRYAAEQSKVYVQASTVTDAIRALTSIHPSLTPYIYDEGQAIRKHVRIYLGEQDIRELEGVTTSLKEGDELSIIPAIAGGTDEIVSDRSKSLKEIAFSKEELERYSRHLILPEFNIEGQRKLKAARVLVIGTGGLGAPLLLYLTAAGVGTIGIVDFDVVDKSNLQRQVLFSTADVGRPKVEAARDRLSALNPFVHFEIHNTRFDSSNALDLVSQYDIIADGTDNFPTRYLVNDAAVLADKVNVYASIYRFEGQASVFNYRLPDGSRGPNYRDLFPTPPPPGFVPSCAEGGVIGVLPGILGSLQANEVIKVISGVGEPLAGRLFQFDAAEFKTRIFKLTKDPDNPLTGVNPTQTGLIDYDFFCGLGDVPLEKEAMSEITVTTLEEWRNTSKDFQLIDVREPFEYEIANLGGLLIPKGEILNHLDEIDRHRDVVVHCKGGVRSAQAIETLRDHGFTHLYNLKGGILAWAREIDTEVPVY